MKKLFLWLLLTLPLGAAELGFVPYNTTNRTVVSGLTYPGGTFSGNGAGLTNLDATSISGSLSLSGDSSINVGTVTAGSSDYRIQISRAVDDASGAGNGHAFSDASLVSRAGVIGYNSFNALAGTIGTNDFDHIAAFQTAGRHGSSGTMLDFYGLASSFTATNGHVGNAFGAYIGSPVQNGGTISNSVAAWLYASTAAATNSSWGVYQAGGGSNWFSGHVYVPTILATGGVFGLRGTLPTDRQVFIYAASTKTAGLRLQQSGYNYWDVLTPASQTRLDFQDVAGVPRLSLIGGGNVGIGTTNPASRLQVAGTVTASNLVANTGFMLQSNLVPSAAVIGTNTIWQGNVTNALWTISVGPDANYLWTNIVSGP